MMGITGNNSFVKYTIILCVFLGSSCNSVSTTSKLCHKKFILSRFLNTKGHKLAPASSDKEQWLVNYPTCDSVAQVANKKEAIVFIQKEYFDGIVTTVNSSRRLSHSFKSSAILENSSFKPQAYIIPFINSQTQLMGEKIFKYDNKNIKVYHFLETTDYHKHYESYYASELGFFLYYDTSKDAVIYSDSSSLLESNLRETLLSDTIFFARNRILREKTNVKAFLRSN
jgi:hypothetical protein